MFKISKLIFNKTYSHKFIYYIQTTKTEPLSTKLISDQNPYIRLGFPNNLKKNSLLKKGRYDKPIGTLLLYLPCTWGIALGAPPFDFLNSNEIKIQKY